VASQLPSNHPKNQTGAKVEQALAKELISRLGGGQTTKSK